MTENNVSRVLREALAERPEIASRADRCRAALSDGLGPDAAKHRREVMLLVAAVEERIPDALRTATTIAGVDAIAKRFEEDRSLQPDAAAWAVDTWSDALRSASNPSIPARPRPADAGPAAEPDSVPSSETVGLHATVLPAAASVAAQPTPEPGRTSLDPGSEPPLAPPPTAEPSDPKSNRGPLVAIGALVVVVLIAGVIYAVTKGDDKKGQAASKSTTTTMMGSSAAFPNKAETALLAHVPQDSQTCKRYSGDEKFDMSLAVVECAPHIGPKTAEYVAFASVSDLREHFDHFVMDVNPGAGTCLATASSKFEPAVQQKIPVAMNMAKGKPAASAGPGQMICWQEDGHLAMVWTNEKLKILGQTMTGSLDGPRMMQWWNALAGPCVDVCMNKM